MEHNLETSLVADAPRHYTHINFEEEIELLRCCAGDCRCHKVHCPFCDVQHFKPAGSMRVRDHITQSHFKYAVTVGNILILKCFHQCHMSPGHFHCPYCEQQLYKRIAFAHHLKSHLRKMGKDETVVHFFYSNQPTTINFDGIKIALCTDPCGNTLKQHYHCPLCKRNNFGNMGVMVTHLWRCRDRRKHRRSLSCLQTSDDYLQDTKYLLPLREILADKWHCSIVRTVDDLQVVQCDRDDCCGNQSHCPLCPPDRFQPTVGTEVKQHGLSHWDCRVTYVDYSMLTCYLDCGNRNRDSSGPVQGHYHCPFCGQTHGCKDGFTSHLPICYKGDNSFESQPEETPPFSQDNGSDSLVGGEEIGDSPKGSDRRVSMDKSEHNMLPVETVLPVTKTEMFETITAVLCKEMVTRLENKGSKLISNVLGEVTRLSDCTWSWSPGTQGRVYALTGGLENLQDAKRRLMQILNTTNNEEQQKIDTISGGAANIISSSISTQTDISFTDSLKMAALETSAMDDESMTVQMDDESFPVQMAGEAVSREEHSIDSTSTDLKEHRNIKRRKCLKDVDENVVLKRKPGRPRKYCSEKPRTSFPGFKEHETSKTKKKNADVQRVKNSVRTLSRVSSSPYSKRKPISRISQSSDDGPRYSGKYDNKKTNLKNTPLVKQQKTDLTETAIKKAYGTRGRKMDFSLLATGKTKKDKDNSGLKKEILAKSVNVDRKTELKKLSVKLVDISKRRIKSISQPEDGLDKTEDEMEQWEDDADGDPDFVPDGKKRVLDSYDDSVEDSKEMTARVRSLGKTERNSIHKPVTAERTKITAERTKSESENIDRDLPQENQMFYVPKITVPLSSLHHSIQRMRPRDGMQSGDDVYLSVDTLADVTNLRCSCCDFAGRSSVELMEHIMDVHQLDPRHPCSGCGKRFITHQSRSLHLQNMGCGRDNRSSPVHHCTKCSSFTSERFSDVTDHLILQHQVVNPLRCDVCEKRLKDKQKHLKHHHGPKTRFPGSYDTEDLGCPVCEFTSYQFSDVTDHLVEIHGVVDPLRCDVCEVTFKQSKAYHLKQKHGPLNRYIYDKSTSCLLCRTSFDLFSDLTQHIIDEHKMDNVRCDVCEMIFSSKHVLYDHVNKTHGPSDIQCCNICGRGFNTVRALVKHRQMIHHVQTTMVKSCKKCDFKAQSKKELKEHMETHAVANECPICHKVLAKHTNIMIHIDTMHTKQEECVCNICGKKFRHPRYLRLHLGRHSGVKPHVCSVCGKRFFATNTLRCHMEVHKDQSERQYRHICSVCGRGFNGKSSLDDHMNKHTGAKPHSCPLCGVKFGFRSMLYKHHQFVHSNLRPFSCTICPKSYKSKQRLSAHMVSHTGISRFNCLQCKKAFSTSSTLKQHIPRCRGERQKENLLSSRAGILQTENSENEIIIHLVNGQDGTVKIEPLDHGDVIQIVEEMAGAGEVLGEVGQGLGEGGQGEQVSQVFVCSVCAMSFQTYEEAESHIATNHLEPEPELSEQPQQPVNEAMQTSVTPKQEIFDYW
ncbi:uncharacterized protein LOC121390382 [Gigantopelta aegis]|uniref:uncharacterized protein LOC121390382 n=1 Tax=Gigantopelta aegis TaxID=1735272 RepID=UPI001B88C680|nr:uncharacterized protein LOC121390382 [Gigantopelta aegis]